MIVTILGSGTSSGVPMMGCHCKVCTSNNPKDNRLRASVLIETGGKKILIDTGPDMRLQMLRAKVNALDAVIYTHEHNDHISGLDEIRPFNFFQQKPMDIYLTEQVEYSLRKRFHYVFEEKTYPGLPEVNLHRITLHPFYIDDVKIIPIQVYHYNLPVLGFRINDFTYITDANFLPDTEKQKIAGTKVLVLNALRKEKHISHFTLDEALDLIAELKPETAYLTHISHQLGLHNAVEATLPSNVHLAYDGLRIEF